MQRAYLNHVKQLCRYNVITQGMALFQVLLITAIMSLLLLIMAAFTQQSLQQARQVQQVTAAYTKLYSAANQLSFALLTEEWLGPESGQERYGWNFFGQPFLWQPPTTDTDDSADLAEPLIVTLQDVNGLLDLRFASEELKRYLQAEGFDAASVQQAVTELTNSQQYIGKLSAGIANEHWPYLQLQHLSELQHIPGWDAEKVAKLANYSRFIGEEFNIALAPNSLLATLLPPTQFAIIESWRQEGSFDHYKFMELTGITEAEGASFFPGMLFIISISDQQRRYKLTLTVRVEPNAKTPLLILQQRFGY